MLLKLHVGFPGCTVVKSPPASVGGIGNGASVSESGRSTAPEFLSGNFHGQRSMAGYSPWGCKESNRTERTHTHKLHVTFSVVLRIF